MGVVNSWSWVKTRASGGTPPLDPLPNTSLPTEDAVLGRAPEGGACRTGACRGRGARGEGGDAPRLSQGRGHLPYHPAQVMPL